jgi:hypothetical protein
MRDAHDTVSRYIPPGRVVEDESTPGREREEDLSRRAA